MKKITEEEKKKILEEISSKKESVTKILHDHNVPKQTYYNWLNKNKVVPEVVPIVPVEEEVVPEVVPIVPVEDQDKFLEIVKGTIFSFDEIYQMIISTKEKIIEINNDTKLTKKAKEEKYKLLALRLGCALAFDLTMKQIDSNPK